MDVLQVIKFKGKVWNLVLEPQWTLNWPLSSEVVILTRVIMINWSLRLAWSNQDSQLYQM